MTTALLSGARIEIDDRTIAVARDAASLEGSTLLLRTADGTDVALPDELQGVLLGALASIAHDGRVTIGRLPDELTSTVAADLLGISRPTLMKLARDGGIESFKVGTHTRFRRDEVLRVREARARQRSAAFEDLRNFNEEHGDLFED